MRPNLVISPEELGRDDIEPGVPPAEVRRWESPVDGTEAFVIRAPKASYPDGVVSFWKAARACAEMLDSSERCAELSEEGAIDGVRSFVRRAGASHEFELRSSFVVGQRMTINRSLHESILLETEREYVAALYFSAG